MKTLIPMVAFVKEQNIVLVDLKLLETDWAKEFEIRFKRVQNYANFLSKTPHIGMFVAADFDGNVLEYPRQVAPEGIKWADYVREYTEALDRVLFKGFEVFCKNEDFVRIELKDKLFITFYIEGLIVVNAPFAESKNISTLEDLTKYNIEFTDSAIKQLE